MLIRQQDKSIIHYVALLGAVLSALGMGFVVWSMPEDQQSFVAMQHEVSQEASAFNKLTEAGIMPEQFSAAKAAAEGLAAQSVQEVPVWRFWESMAAWQLVSIALCGAAVSGALSYAVIWITMYLGSVLMYVLIRRIYSLLKYVSPSVAATCGQTVMVDGQPVIQRDPTRILPLLIKLIVLMSLTLVLLAVIVWQLTSFKF